MVETKWKEIPQSTEIPLYGLNDKLTEWDVKRGFAKMLHSNAFDPRINDDCPTEEKEKDDKLTLTSWDRGLEYSRDNRKMNFMIRIEKAENFGVHRFL